ncbi:MFS transporter [Streptomyces sp. NPDC004838]
MPSSLVTTADRRGPALVVLCFVQFMLVLDDTVVNVALPTIRDELGFGTAGLVWVVNAYFLAFGALLLPAGRAADLLGRRRVFLAGVALFGMASLLCGLAREPWQLVAGRFTQGVGAALASPAAMALITLLFPGGKERAKALGVWGGLAALGGTTGLVLSGALTGLVSWRWIFLVNLPIALAALLSMPRLVAESRGERPSRVDVPGAVLGTGALLALVHGLLRAAESGWVDPAASVPLVLAAVLGTAFLAVEARTAEPLVPLSFLAVRIRAVANGTGLLFTAAFFSLSFLLMLYLQTVLGYGPLTAGLAYVPHGVGVLAGVWLSARAVAWLGVRWTLVTAFLLSAAGLLLLSGLSAGDGYVFGVLPGMLVASLGSGLGFPALAVAAVTGTTERDAGLGSAVLGSVQQVGGAVGLAVLVPLAARHGGASESAGPAGDGFAVALRAAAALLVLGAALVAALLGGDGADGRTSGRADGRLTEDGHREAPGTPTGRTEPG